MTQNNERDALHKIMAQVQVYASSYSLVGTRFATDNQLEEADREKLALYNMVKSALSQSPISQSEQQEAVAWQFYQDGEWFTGSNKNNHKQNTIDGGLLTRELFASPPKQIPDGWKPIETVPKDGKQVIIKCSGGRVATAFYDDKPFVGEGWHVVVPFLGGVGSGTDTFIYFQEDMPTHWMPLPAATLKEKG